MAERARAGVLVLGVGNPDRGDDGVGRIVAQTLRSAAAGSASVEIAEADGEAASLLEWIEGREAVVIVDACAAGDAPGAVRCFDVGETPLPVSALGVSSHGLGLHQAIELARALGALPAKCVVYAIEGASFEIGAPLSGAVAAAAAKLAQALAEQLKQPMGAPRA